MSENDHGLEFQDQSPTYRSDTWKAIERDPLNDSGVVLTEESPIKVDDHAPDPSAHESSGIGIVFEDRAHDYDPASDPEPPRPVAIKPPATTPKPSAPTPTEPSPRLPSRRAAVAPVVDLTRPGVAVCTTCDAKNAPDARLCARCGAAFEVPTAPSGRLQHGGVLKAEFAPKNRGPVDAELIPDHVKEQWREQEAQVAERMGFRQKHRKQVAKELAIASAIAFALASLLLGMALPAWARSLMLLVDAGLGVGVATIVFHTGVGRLPAGVIYGAAGFVTHTIKLTLIGVGGSYVGVALFLMWLGIIGLTGFLGWGAGFQLEMQRWDQEI